MNLQKRLWILLVILLLSRAASAEGPLAKVVLVKGNVKLKRDAIKDEKKNVLQLEEFEVVFGGDIIEVAEGAELTLILRKDHRRCRIEKAGQFRMGKDGLTPKDGVHIEATAKRSRLSEKDFDRALDLSRPGVAIARGVTKLPPPITPVPGSTLTTDRPTFRWPAFPEAQLYRVQLWEDIENQPRKPIWTKETNETSLEYDGEPLPSPPGTTYRWAVGAQEKNQLWTEFLDTRTFRVANAEDREFAARLSEAAEDDDVVEVVLSAKALAEKRMVVEAITAYEHLVQLAPESIRLRLDLIDLYRQAGMSEQAENQIKECDKLGHRFVDDTDGEKICH